MPQFYTELAKGFALVADVDFPSEDVLSVDGHKFSRLLHDWIDEHPKETAGGGDRPHRKFRFVVEAVD